MAEAIISRRGGGEYGTAIAKEVLRGKTFGTEDGLVTGTMPDRGAITSNINSQGGSYTIPEGYHSGGGKITANITMTPVGCLKKISSSPTINGSVKICCVDGDYIYLTNNGNLEKRNKGTFSLVGSLSGHAPKAETLAVDENYLYFVLNSTIKKVSKRSMVVVGTSGNIGSSCNGLDIFDGTLYHNGYDGGQFIFSRSSSTLSLSGKSSILSYNSLSGVSAFSSYVFFIGNGDYPNGAIRRISRATLSGISSSSNIESSGTLIKGSNNLFTTYQEKNGYTYYYGIVAFNQNLSRVGSTRSRSSISLRYVVDKKTSQVLFMDYVGDGSSGYSIFCIGNESLGDRVNYANTISDLDGSLAGEGILYVPISNSGDSTFNIDRYITQAFLV